MSRRFGLLLITLSVAFGAAAVGLLIGIFYDLYPVAVRHTQLENALGGSISYNKIFGGLGISGMILFFGFLLSVIADKK